MNDFNSMSKDQIINWMSRNLSTKELEECLNKTGSSGMSGSKTPTLSSSSSSSSMARKRTSSGGFEEGKRGSGSRSGSGARSGSGSGSGSSVSSTNMLNRAKKKAQEMCKGMKHIVIKSVTFKGAKKTESQIKYNVSKRLLRKSTKGAKGDVIALTLTLKALQKECKQTKTKKNNSNFGNKKRMEKYLLKLLRPN